MNSVFYGAFCTKLEQEDEDELTQEQVQQLQVQVYDRQGNPHGEVYVYCMEDYGVQVYVNNYLQRQHKTDGGRVLSTAFVRFLDTDQESLAILLEGRLIVLTHGEEAESLNVPTYFTKIVPVPFNGAILQSSDPSLPSAVLTQPLERLLALQIKKHPLQDRQEFVSDSQLLQQLTDHEILSCLQLENPQQLYLVTQSASMGQIFVWKMHIVRNSQNRQDSTSSFNTMITPANYLKSNNVLLNQQSRTSSQRSKSASSASLLRSKSRLRTGPNSQLLNERLFSALESSLCTPENDDENPRQQENLFEKENGSKSFLLEIEKQWELPKGKSYSGCVHFGGKNGQFLALINKETEQVKVVSIGPRNEKEIVVSASDAIALQIDFLESVDFKANSKRLLVLTSQKQLVLFDGNVQLCKVLIQQFNSYQDVGLRRSSFFGEEQFQSSGSIIAGICHGAGDRFNIVDKDDNQYRYSLQLVPKSASSLLLVQALYTALDVRSFGEFIQIYSEELGTAEVITQDVEFAMFMKLFRKWTLGLCEVNRSDFDKPSTRSEKQQNLSIRSSALYRKLQISYNFGKKSAQQHVHNASVLKQNGSPRDKDDLEKMLWAFHYVYESCKFDVGLQNSLLMFGEATTQLAYVLNLSQFLEVYRRDLGSCRVDAWVQTVQNAKVGRGRNVQCMHVMDSMTSLMFLLKGSFQPQCYPDSNISSKLSQWVPSVKKMMDVMELYKMIAALEPDIYNSQEKRIVERMALQFGWGPTEIDTLPEGIALPIRQVLKHLSLNPPQQWLARCYTLIDRQDLAATTCTATCSQLPTSSSQFAWFQSSRANESLSASLVVSPPTSPLTPKRTKRNSSSTKRQQQASKVEGSMVVPYQYEIFVEEGNQDGKVGAGSSEEREKASNVTRGQSVQEDGMAAVMEQQDNMRFRKDQRLQDIRLMLRTSEPVILKAVDPPAADGAARQQLRMMSFAQRTLALSVGRGAFSLGSKQLLPRESIQIPVLQTSGQVEDNGRKGAKIGLDFNQFQRMVGTDAASKEAYLLWPKFHNAVAAGLTISPSGMHMSHTWVRNMPLETLTNAQINDQSAEDVGIQFGGMVYALGLTGRFNEPAVSNIVDLILQKQETSRIGALLGLAVGNRGSMNQDICKALRVSTPNMHPRHFPEVELPSTIQTAAVLGIGFLYEGNGDLATANDLLNEIGKECQTPAGNNAAIDPNNQNQWGNHSQQSERAGYSLAAGISVGLVMLRQAGTYPKLERRLKYLMTGVDDYGITGNSKVGLVGPGELPELFPLDEVLGKGTSINDVIRREALQASSLVYDNFSSQNGTAMNGRGLMSSMNVDSNQSNTSQLTLEGSLVNLDVTAPPAILALALIYLKTNDTNRAKLFNIPSTRYELKSLKPDLILLKSLARGLVLWDRIRPSVQWISDSLPPIICEFPQGAHTSDLNQSVDEMLDTLLGMSNSNDRDERELLAHAHVAGVVGCAMAIGFRYAGSHNPLAKTALLTKLKFFWRQKLNCEPGNPSLPNLESALEQAICNIAVAVSLVMAGTGDLEVLKALRGLQMRLAQVGDKDDEHPFPLGYGSHMAISMAIGFLFLGGGTRTFTTSDSAIVALIVACYPMWPNQPNDNSCHLQAFRHLYVLAAERRMVEAIDVDSKKPDVVPIRITTKQKEVIELFCPCLLPPQSDLLSVEIIGDRFHSQLLQGQDVIDALYHRQTIWVKKRQGMLSHLDDPSGIRSLLSKAYTYGTSNTPGKIEFSLRQLCKVFKASPYVKGFATFLPQNRQNQKFAQNRDLQERPFLEQNDTFLDFCARVLFKCLTSENTQVVTLFIRMHCMLEFLLSLEQNVEYIPPNPIVAQELTNLNVILMFYRTEYVREQLLSSKQKSSLLLSREFLTQLQFQLDQLWERCVFQSQKQRQSLVNYVSASSKSRLSYDGLFGYFLAFNKIPGSEIICQELQNCKKLGDVISRQLYLNHNLATPDLIPQMMIFKALKTKMGQNK